jgi:hypothetical protein
MRSRWLRTYSEAFRAESSIDPRAERLRLVWERA